MVGAAASWSSVLGSIPGQEQYVLFLDQTLYSHSTSLHPSIYMGTGKFNAMDYM